MNACATSHPIAHVCETCGTQFAPSLLPPSGCPICQDERQYVGWNGQQWTCHPDLQRRFGLRIGHDDGLLAFAVDGSFAIPQRALHLRTGAGNLLWECLPLVTDDAVAALQAAGGVDRIVISHPHFYTAMHEWSQALGGVEILLHAADRDWVQYPSPHIRYWEGDVLPLSDDVTLLNVGSHFPGSTALHWATGPRGQGALFPGDALQVRMDRRYVSPMYSYPNHIPARPRDVRRMRALLAPLGYEDLYGFSWGRNLIDGARVAVEASFDQYFEQVDA